MNEAVVNDTEPKVYRATLGASLESAAVLALLYRQSDLATIKALGIAERPYLFDYFGLELPMTAETTASELMAEVAAMHVVRAEAYARGAALPNKVDKVLSCRPGYTVGEEAVPMVQQAQRWGNALFQQDNPAFTRTRYVFEFNDEKIDFNPWTVSGAELAETALASQRARGAAYRQSAEYKSAERERREHAEAEVKHLQQQESELMAALPETLNGPLAGIMRWVTAYADCHDRAGVRTDSSAVGFAFAEAGFKENAFVGKEFQGFLDVDKDLFGRYIIGQFLNILPMNCGMPGVLWHFAERYHAMPDTDARA